MKLTRIKVISAAVANRVVGQRRTAERSAIRDRASSTRPMSRNVGVALVFLSLVISGCAEGRTPSTGGTGAEVPRASAGANPEAVESPTVTIDAFGDSLTQNDYTTALAELLPQGVEVVNHGTYGQSSGMIAVRQGGITLSVDAVTIPEQGPVAVVPQASIGEWNDGAVESAWAAGTVADVAGTLTRAEDGGWVFTRSVPGSPVAVESGTAFISGEAQRPGADAILISWVGRNDIAFDWPDEMSGAVAATQSMIEHQSDARRRFLVVSVTTAVSEPVGSAGYVTVAEINAGLQTAWPANFVDVRRHIIDHGLDIAGITPTAADSAAIAADTLPPSLMADDVHPNELCRDLVIAPFMLDQLRDRSWL